MGANKMRVAALAACIALACLLSAASAFYLPGVAPQDYSTGEVLQMKVNKLSSVKTQLPYEYYTLPYCKPDKVVHSVENLGEVIRGDRIENSVYLVRSHGRGCARTNTYTYTHTSTSKSTSTSTRGVSSISWTSAAQDTVRRMCAHCYNAKRETGGYTTGSLSRTLGRMLKRTGFSVVHQLDVPPPRRALKGPHVLDQPTPMTDVLFCPVPDGVSTPPSTCRLVLRRAIYARLPLSSTCARTPSALSYAAFRL